jgi:hypothetical protein
MSAGSRKRPGGRWTATPLARLAAFAASLAVLAGVAALVGRASGLEVDDAAEPAGHNAAGAAAHGGERRAATGDAGLSDSAAGLRLLLEPATLGVGAVSRLRLSIVDRHGEPIGALHAAHGEPPLHLILVRRDLSGYQHLHPEPSGEGYVVDVALPLPGVWRAYADFEVDGEKIVLGRDLFVPGDLRPQRLAPPRQTASVDGYGIRLRRGADLTFEITRRGRPVSALQPYLGAAGHLVAIREDDLAYLHVHPLESSRSGTITFEAELEEPGRYALFFQFRHGGRVHTVPFTMVAT